MDLHVFPIPIPPPASLSIPSLWVFPVQPEHQPWALVSCIQLDTGLIPGQGTKIPHAAGQLSPWATTREACAPQWKIPQTGTHPHTGTKILSTITKTRCSQINIFKNSNGALGSQRVWGEEQREVGSLRKPSNNECCIWSPGHKLGMYRMDPKKLLKSWWTELQCSVPWGRGEADTWGIIW